MDCEMCGAETQDIYKTLIEGTQMKVCEGCSKYGNVLGVVSEVVEEKKEQQPVVQKRAEPEIVDMLVEDYAQKIKRKREKLGLKQEDFAKKINEKESIMQKIENGKFTPSIELARKISRFLEITLVEEVEEEQSIVVPKGTGGEVTIGDMIKVKKR